MFVSLKHTYISVAADGTASYGGNQMRSANGTERAVGCGLIAGLDLLLYLSRYHLQDTPDAAPLPFDGEAIPDERYWALVSSLRKKYLPLIPRHGINGLFLALGLNAWFLKHRFPFRAFWAVPYPRLWNSIRDMLERDLPVVISVGPNLPLIWQRHKLRFYIKTPSGSYLPGPQTLAHYVTVTGMDEEWLRVSSWGRMYYINCREYLLYVKEHSAKLVSNILVIRKKGHGE